MAFREETDWRSAASKQQTVEENGQGEEEQEWTYYDVDSTRMTSVMTIIPTGHTRNAGHALHHLLVNSPLLPSSLAIVQHGDNLLTPSDKGKSGKLHVHKDDQNKGKDNIVSDNGQWTLTLSLIRGDVDIRRRELKPKTPVEDKSLGTILLDYLYAGAPTLA
ncbi:hypothetical protein Bbelb_074540 [Branchiostoma belcheri]|nr:hypothetical protein Bbelb_074540 [Branchiostoma belcheri]